MTILITGFGPFPGARFNPTGELVARLVRARRVGDVRLVGNVFQTSYAAVDAALPGLLKQHQPDVVLMFGLASRTKFLRIETRARNTCSVLLPDASGRLRAPHIVPGGPASLRARAPFVPLLRALHAARLPARLSHNAGRYLCNYGYWRAAEATSTRMPLVLFVHVPKIGQTARPSARVRRRMVSMSDLVRGGEAVLRLLIASARRR